jgi:hypothetical protein
MSAETQTDQLQHFADFARDFAAKAQALAAGEATTTPHEVYHGADALIELHEAALSELTRLRAVEAAARAAASHYPFVSHWLDCRSAEECDLWAALLDLRTVLEEQR